MEEKTESKGVEITDFIIPEKIDAFCNSYAPVDNESQADEVFTDTKLRKYFQAYLRNVGDPLAWYVEELIKNKNFVMRTSILGEPAIFVRIIERNRNMSLIDIFDD